MLSNLLPLLVAAMLAFMFWRAAVRLRHDRVRTERELTRGKHAFTPRQRIRFLLSRAYRPHEDEPEWQQELQSSLDQATLAHAEAERAKD